MLKKDQEAGGITRIHVSSWKTANFVELSSLSLARRAQGDGHSRIEVCGIRFVHIFFIDNSLLMSAYLKIMNVDTTGRMNVHDNNLIDN